MGLLELRHSAYQVHSSGAVVCAAAEMRRAKREEFHSALTEMQLANEHKYLLEK